MNDLKQSKPRCAVIVALLAIMILFTSLGTSAVSANRINWQANSVQQIKSRLQKNFDAVTRQYHIQFGDTINGIAEALNVNANTIVADNQVSDANLIYTGNQLYITQQQNGYVPASTGYQVAQEIPTASLISEFDGIELHQVVAK